MFHCEKMPKLTGSLIKKKYPGKFTDINRFAILSEDLG